jgi:hypothetical protein
VTCADWIPVERLREGDVVRAVAYGPVGRVTDADRRGWTLVAWPPKGTVMPYRHGEDRLILLRSAD